MTEQIVSNTGFFGNCADVLRHETTAPAQPGFYVCTWAYPHLGTVRLVNYYDEKGWRDTAPLAWAGTDPATLPILNKVPQSWRTVQPGDIHVDPFARLTTRTQLDLRDDHARARDQLAALRQLLARAHEAVADLGDDAALTLQELELDLEQQHAEADEALRDSLAEA